MIKINRIKHIIEQTDDGSKTLFVPGLNEHYHSTKGALTESQHVFIDMGMSRVDKDNINILEIGFGTGLNAFLTLLKAKEAGKQVKYTTLELYPLSWDIVEELDYTGNPLFARIHKTGWGIPAKITEAFSLLKLKVDFTEYRFESFLSFDVVYFDAFAPEKQPEMWSQPLFDYLYSIMAAGSVLTTYCAKGIIRRMLRHSGFEVERLAGPPGGKREILRATKI